MSALNGCPNQYTRFSLQDGEVYELNLNSSLYDRTRKQIMTLK